MAQSTINAPRIAAPRKRVLFGLLDADGWPWAIVKSTFWFVLIIILLGYIPDRAYYFTVQRTVDIAFPTLWWSPINLCPPENETLPCPAPAGASLPWHPSPGELNLPAVRTDGVGAVAGTTYLYTGGSDGTAPVATTYVSHAVGTGNLSTWTQGPDLPEARADAASVVIGTTLYVIGGFGPDGQPTSTVYSLTVNNDGTLGDWTDETALALPAPRAGASAVSVSDGLVVLGGTDGSAATKDVWKTQTDADTGEFGPWVPQQPLFEENVDGVAAHIGDWVFLVGGSKGDGTPVATVQQGLVGGTSATAEDPNAMQEPWRVSAETNLPSPRTDAAGFTINGVLYLQGGSNGSAPITETLWTSPDANGVIPDWHHLTQTDLGQPLAGSAGVVNGSYAFVFGGDTGTGPTAGLARANLAPQEPFFQLGLMGVVIPALQLQGEIGQQIGYLNAATVGAVNFILLIIVGWAYNRPDKVREIVAAIRNRRRKR